MTMQDGVVVAVVEERNDPRKEGRVTLRYKWLPGEPVSGWAPIAAALAGTKRGAWLMPEKGDEVLVAFEKGLFDHPYVVGFLWNGKHTPPDKDLQHRVIITPGGHELRFEDNDKKKQIIIKTAGKHVITLNDTEKKMKVSIESGEHHLIEIDYVKNSITVKTAKSQSVTLTDSPAAITLTTSGNQSVTLSDSPASITLDGGGRKVALANGKVAIT
jgi:uncharacterized protein involved in type VI secretion and phage assembly